MPRRRNTIGVILADQLATDLRTMTEIWMGHTPIALAKREGRLTIAGSRELESSLKSWLSLSRFAKVEKLVA
jgi:hypothetical protein